MASITLYKITEDGAERAICTSLDSAIGRIESMRRYWRSCGWQGGVLDVEVVTVREDIEA